MAIKITTFELKDWSTDTFRYDTLDGARYALTNCLTALEAMGYTFLFHPAEGRTRTITAQHESMPNRQVVVNWLD